MLRFAPSPTGDMHIGNLRVAIFNYIVAQQKNEELIVRIEDSDKERNIEGKDQEILLILEKLGISYSKVIYQSDNSNFHQQFAMKLLLDKKAFSCFCTDETLDIKREKAKKLKLPYRYDDTCISLSDEYIMNNENPFVVRVKKPEKIIEFTDIIKGKFSYEPKDVDSFIILRKNKDATYNFACSVDDMISNITTVIRGEDHLTNTPKQIHIREQLGYEDNIEYIHLPIILNSDGKKMSKRDNSSSVIWLLEEGFVPEAIVNYLILMGNKPQSEIFSLQDAIEWFDIQKISKSPAKFDIDMLRFINRKQILNMDDLRLSQFLEYSDVDIGRLAKLYTEEASTIVEIKSKIDAIFSSKKEMEDFSNEYNLIINAIKNIGFKDDFNELKKEITAQTELKGKHLFKPLRYILTGALDGPNLSDIYPHIKNYIMEIVK